MQILVFLLIVTLFSKIQLGLLESFYFSSILLIIIIVGQIFVGLSNFLVDSFFFEKNRKKDENYESYLVRNYAYSVILTRVIIFFVVISFCIFTNPFLVIPAIVGMGFWFGYEFYAEQKYNIDSPEPIKDEKKQENKL